MLFISLRFTLLGPPSSQLINDCTRTYSLLGHTYQSTVFSVKSFILKIFISHFNLFKQSFSDLAYFYIEEFCNGLSAEL